MSDTPETDYALHGVWYRGDGPGALPDHARRLERERDRAEAMVRRASRHMKELAMDFPSERVRLMSHDLVALVSIIDAEKKIRDGMKR